MKEFSIPLQNGCELKGIAYIPHNPNDLVEHVNLVRRAMNIHDYSVPLYMFQRRMNGVPYYFDFSDCMGNVVATCGFIQTHAYEDTQRAYYFGDTVVDPSMRGNDIWKNMFKHRLGVIKNLEADAKSPVPIIVDAASENTTWMPSKMDELITQSPDFRKPDMDNVDDRIAVGSLLSSKTVFDFSGVTGEVWIDENSTSADGELERRNFDLYTNNYFVAALRNLLQRNCIPFRQRLYMDLETNQLQPENIYELPYSIEQLRCLGVWEDILKIADISAESFEQLYSNLSPEIRKVYLLDQNSSL